MKNFINLGIVMLSGAVLARGEERKANQSDPGSRSDANSLSYLQASPEQLKWWREARFGLFIHWGPVSLKGTEIGWSRRGERRGTGGTGAIPVEEYDNLYKEFNPVRFNARDWVALAGMAGMKYLVFTTKHHDGFCEWDSRLTEYKITRSPFGRDVVAELAQACQEVGLPLGFYYSQPDWRHPDYRTERHGRYLEYMRGHLRELLTGYGRVDILWFDGLGGSAKDWDSVNLFREIRNLQPHILINNRAGLPADWDTPEQEIGHFQAHRPWETCMTLGDQWAWKPNDRLKSIKQCLHTLIRCAGGDGNLLFNVGPMPTGEIEPRQVERLKGMGEWLKQYGQSIYGTRGGPFKPGGWGASTRRGSTIYLHLLDPGASEITLPPIGPRIIRWSFLTGGEAKVEQSAESIRIKLAPGASQDIDTLVQLELDGSAMEIPPVAVSSGSLSSGRPVRASQVFQGQTAQYGPEKVVDDDETSTRWATDPGTKQAWLEIDLEEPTEIGKIIIREAFAGRVRKFELQGKNQALESWKTFASGAELGHFETRVEGVRARYVRLNILEAVEGPTIWEFQVFKREGSIGRANR